MPWLAVLSVYVPTYIRYCCACTLTHSKTISSARTAFCLVIIGLHPATLSQSLCRLKDREHRTLCINQYCEASHVLQVCGFDAGLAAKLLGLRNSRIAICNEKIWDPMRRYIASRCLEGGIPPINSWPFLMCV